MPSWLDIGLKLFTVVLSVAAFAISVRAFKRAGPLTDLQTRIATLELAAKKRAQDSLSKADIRASLYPAGQYSHHLIIENKGGATAVNVNIEFLNPEHETIFPEGERERNLPIAALEAGQHVPILAALASGRWPPFDIALTWGDPDGSEQRKVGKLRLA
jgi:hypothetical protein